MKNLFKLFLVITLGLTVSACSSKSEEYETYVRGEWEENVYSNEFIGLTFTYPEGFTLLTDEELINMFEIELDDSKFDEKIDNIYEAMELATIFFDFTLINYNTGESLMLMGDDLTKSNGIDVSLDVYMDVLIENLVSVLEYSYVIGDKYDVEIAGETYRVVDVTIDDIAIQKVYIRKKSKYMIALTTFEIIGLENGIAKVFEEIKNN